MWFNPFMTWLLRSPLHGFISSNTMLVTYTGRKSGKTYTTPVNYLRMKDSRGEYLLTTSTRERTWWRNLRGGAAVTLRLQGKDLPAQAEVLEDEGAVIDELGAFFEKAPKMAKYFGVRLEANGKPDRDDLARAAVTRVVVRTVVG
jgi:deazaflavin-dependent oxidoreductase (nitroreductase family)